MAVRAQQRRAGLAEAFQMDLMADAVACAGADDAEAGRRALEIEMIVVVLETDLLGVVIDIYQRKVRLDLG